jgi:hypothetical protein
MRIKLGGMNAAARALYSRLLTEGHGPAKPALTPPVAPAAGPATSTPRPPRPDATLPLFHLPEAGVAVDPKEDLDRSDEPVHAVQDLTDLALEATSGMWPAQALAPTSAVSSRFLSGLPAHGFFAAGALTALAACAIGLGLGYGIWGGRDDGALQAAAAPAAGPQTAPSAPIAPPPTIEPRLPESPPPQPASAAAGEERAAAPEDAPSAIASTRCAATIDSVPTGVDVSWNRKRLGRTPLAGVTVPCGRATIVASRARYDRVTTEATAEPGVPAVVALQLARPSVTVDLASRPPGAVFRIKGRVIGKGPTRATVRAFERIVVSAEKPGYQPWRQRLYVKRGGLKVDAALKPNGARSTADSSRYHLSP